MEKFTLFVEEGKIIVQEYDYIEDGWYVKIEGDKISLFSIPLGGGDECKVGEFETLFEAIEAGKNLI